MFIRVKENKGGSQSVLLVAGERVPGKKHSLLRVIKNFGYGSDPEAIEALKISASEYKAKLEREVPRVKTLRISSTSDIRNCQSFNCGFADVYGSIFTKLFAGIDIKLPYFNRLRDLITLRIAEPGSKLRTSDIAYKYGIDLKIDNIYKLMDRLNHGQIEQIKKAVYNNTKALLAEHKQDLEVLFYDLTTIYFETNTQDSLRNFGFSKDGKHQHVQILLAMIVTHDGLPVSYEYFTGNCYEGHTLIPVLNKLKAQYSIRRVVLVADAALMNKINLTDLQANGYEYVIAARIKNSTQAIKDAVINTTGYSEVSTTVDKVGQVADFIQAKILDTEEGDKLVTYYSSLRARKDEHDRLKALEKIKAHINSSSKSKLTSSLKKSYVKVTKGCKVEIDENKLEADRQFDGHFGLRTNIKEPDPRQLLQHYRGLWQVEQSFRLSKHNLEIRPVFHYNTKRIEAHLLVCYAALAVIRHTEFILKRVAKYLPFEHLHSLLTKMRKVIITDKEGQKFQLLEDPPPELAPIYQSLQIKWPKKFTYKV